MTEIPSAVDTVVVSEERQGDWLDRLGIRTLLSARTLTKTARACIWLDLCRLAQSWNAPAVGILWSELRPLRWRLPTDRKADYRALKSAVSPGQGRGEGASGRIPSVLERCRQAERRSAEAPEEAKAMLRQCRAELERMWWHWGRGSAWVGLVHAWAPLDRGEAIRLLRRLNADLRDDLVVRWHAAMPLTPEEWTLVFDGFGRKKKEDGTLLLFPLVEKLLAEKPRRLTMPEPLEERVDAYLSTRVVSKAAAEDSKKRTEHLGQYLAWLRLVADRDPTTAHNRLKGFWVALMGADDAFEKDFMARFHLAASVLDTWWSFEACRSDAEQFLREKTPAALRQFVLTNWRVLGVTAGDEIAPAYDALGAEGPDRLSAEMLFWTRLTRRGYWREVLASIGRSSLMAELLPLVQRTIMWGCESAVVQELVPPVGEDEDPVGYFVRLGTPQRRMEYLREHSGRGQRSIPDSLWRPMDSDSRDATEQRDRCSLYDFYLIDEVADRQFATYVRVNTHRHYSYEMIDPLLLEALVSWDDQYPEEVASVLDRMWEVMRVEDSLLADLHRNTKFTRCRTVFAARPPRLLTFVEWVKQTFVDSTYQAGNYVLSFRPTTPFLYCVLAAENVAQVSQRRADALLVTGLEKFANGPNGMGFDRDLVRYAARLYACGKELSAVAAKTDAPTAVLNVWQPAVFGTHLRAVAEAMCEHPLAADGARA
jgi:hypothetical protein